MAESYDPRRIDEDIAAELTRVAAGVSREPAPREFLRVGQPCPETPDVAQPSLVHAIPSVQRAVAVDENGPGHLRVRDVRANGRRGFKRHYHGLYPQVLELVLVLLQLQQVPSAGESTKVPVKHQQEPVALVIGEAVRASLDIG